MERSTALGLIAIFIAGLVPLIWYHPGFVIAGGDNFPIFLNPAKTVSTAMWSPDYLGYASPTPSNTLYNYFGAALGYLGLSIGLTQIIIQVFLYMGAGFAMYFFARAVYPGHRVAPFLAAFFYLFNFFILDSRFNLGFAWLYTFLPLLLALFVYTVNATYEDKRTRSNVGIIAFTLTSVAALSVASINPANIALFLFAIAVFFLYYLVKYRRKPLPLLWSIVKLLAAAVPVNIWWLYPMLNTFIFSPTGLTSAVSVSAWSWTHARATFLNLFWLNGTWGWLPEYIQQSVISYYSYPVVAVLVFVPFAAAAAALLFKGARSKFNAYIMGCILLFVFFASGLREPIAESINMFLYDKISLAAMFREPTSKFTFLLIPFLALLIGYTAQSVANAKINLNPRKLRAAKVSVLLLLAASFVFASLPVLTGQFVETNNQSNNQNVFSNYVQIPHYWTDATNWINSQPGDGKVLLTPLNDFYQLPYTWGYYGSDQLLERFFEKPIVSTEALNGYVTSANTVSDLKQLRDSVKFNNTAEFNTLLDLLSIKYILQRNDVKTDYIVYQKYNYNATEYFPGVNETDAMYRNMESPSEMHSFFAMQPYLKLVKTFGALEIYEYTEAKPSIYALPSSALQTTNIAITAIPVLNQTWDLSNQATFNEWKNATRYNQPQTLGEIIENHGFQVTGDWQHNATGGWLTFRSPLIDVARESTYDVSIRFRVDYSQVNIKTVEYDENLGVITNSSIVRISGNYIDSPFELLFQPKNVTTKYMGIEFRILLDQNNSSFLLNNLSINASVSKLNTDGVEALYRDITYNRTAIILNVENVSPEKTVVTVNASQPFVLATSQVLDKFWVANVDGAKVSSTTTFLGLKGFQINQTGLLTVTLEYPPQTLFNYSLIISAVTVLSLFTILIFVSRETFITLFKRKQLARENR